LPILLAVAAVLGTFAPVLARPGGVVWSRDSDVVSQYEPYLRHAAEAYSATGRLPGWNPVPFGGIPALGNPNAPFLYPPVTPYLAWPSPWLFGLWFALHLAWLGLGTYLLARRLDCSRTAAAFAGLAFALGARVLGHVHAGHVHLLAAVSWLPFALVFAGDLSRRLRAAFPYTIGLAALWAIGSAVAAAPGRPVRALAPVLAFFGAAACGVGLAAAQLLPQWFAAAESVRAGGLGAAFAAEYSVDPASLAGLVLPMPLGHPATGTYWGAPHFWELSTHLGIPVLILSLIAVVGGSKRSWPLAALLLFSLLFAMGRFTPLFPLLFEHVPGLDRLRVPSRAMLVAALTAALLAARGLDRVLSTPADGRVPLARLTLPVAGGACLAVALAWLMSKGPIIGALEPLLAGAADPEAGILAPVFRWPRDPEVVYGTVRTSLVVLAALAVPAILALRLLPRRIAIAVLFAVLLAESWLLGGRFVESRPAAEVFGRNAIADLIGPTDGRFRVLDKSMRLRPSAAQRHGVELVGGYDPLVSRRFALYTDRMAGLEPEFTDACVRCELIDVDPHWRRWWLDWLNVQYLVSRQDLLRRGFLRLKEFREEAGPPVGVFENLEVQPRATLHGTWVTVDGPEEAAERMMASGYDPVLVVEGGPPSSATSEAGSAWLREDEGDRIVIEVTAKSDAMLLVSATWAPGWRATVDDAPASVLPANVALRAVPVPVGEHEVRLEYRAPGFRSGVVVSVATLVLLALGWLLASRGRGDEP
jgi:hypothetical protein